MIAWQEPNTLAVNGLLPHFAKQPYFNHRLKYESTAYLRACRAIAALTSERTQGGDAGYCGNRQPAADASANNPSVLAVNALAPPPVRHWRTSFGCTALDLSHCPALSYRLTTFSTPAGLRGCDIERTN